MIQNPILNYKRKSWRIETDEENILDEMDNLTKNIIIMPTDNFFDIKESKKLKKQIKENLEEDSG